MSKAPAIFRVGDQVRVLGWSPEHRFEVADTADRALLTLRTPAGDALRVGRGAVVHANTETVQGRKR
jgi:hypothetical protein